MSQFPNFVAALREIGGTDVERSEALEVSTKTIERYRAGDLPEPLLKLLRRPVLLRALADDAERVAQNDKSVVFGS